MPIFGDPSSPYDEIVEKVTAETATIENWTLMFDICDRVASEGPRAYKQCLLSVRKRLNHRDPHVVLLALSLLNCLWNNCGAQFRREVSSKDFVGELNYKCTNVKKAKRNKNKRRNANQTKGKGSNSKSKGNKKDESNRVIAERARSLVKKWAENECKKDSSLSLIESLYKDLVDQGYSFEPDPTTQKKKAQISNDPNVVSSEQEEADIAKAIALSLQENGSGKKQQSLTGHNSYPTLQSANNTNPSMLQWNSQPNKQVKALYDFEAAEDNELSFLAGELITVTDDSDQNWWRGTSGRGAIGLFPASFVTTDLTEPPNINNGTNAKDFPQPSEAETTITQPKVQIDENVLLKCIELLEACDPAMDPSDDPPELPMLEQLSKAQAPLIDQKLVQIDKKLNMLAEVDIAIREVLTSYDTAVQQVAIPSTVSMPSPHPHHQPPPPPPVVSSSYAIATSSAPAPIPSLPTDPSAANSQQFQQHPPISAAGQWPQQAPQHQIQ